MNKEPYEKDVKPFNQYIANNSSFWDGLSLKAQINMYEFNNSADTYIHNDKISKDFRRGCGQILLNLLLKHDIYIDNKGNQYYPTSDLRKQLKLSGNSLRNLLIKHKINPFNNGIGDLKYNIKEVKQALAKRRK